MYRLEKNIFRTFNLTILHWIVREMTLINKVHIDWSFIQSLIALIDFNGTFSEPVFIIK